MDELKKRVSIRVKTFADVISDEADEAENEDRFFDKGKIARGLNELYAGLDLDFIDAKQRVNKKGWFK